MTTAPPRRFRKWLPRASAIAAVLLSLNGASAREPGVGGAARPTLVDLAEAYVQLEQSLQANPPRGSAWERVNRAVDAAAGDLFTGDYGRALRTLNEVRLDRVVEGGPTRQHRLAGSLKVTLDPPVVVRPVTMPLSARVRSFYGVEGAAHDRLLLRIGPAAAGVEQVIDPTPGPGGSVDFTVDLDAGGLAAGRHPVRLICDDGVPVTVGRLTVVDRSLSDLRASNGRTLEAVAAAPAAATEICRARNAMLTDHPSSRQLTHWALDPLVLAREIGGEIDALRSGRDPYVGRPGDLWSPRRLAGLEVPCRIYVPPHADRTAPMPLVIALHGAGANEHMFMEAHGCGRIKRLADEHGFIVASPLTYPLATNSAAFGALLDALVAGYPIDPRRVYLLGHSLGALTAVSQSLVWTDRIAGVCSIAGSSKIPMRSGMPPLLVYGAELDRIFPPAALERAALEAHERGVQVEYRHVEHFGHVLVVGAVIDDAIQWLLEQKATERRSDEATKGGGRD